MIFIWVAAAGTIKKFTLKRVDGKNQNVISFFMKSGEKKALTL